MREVRIKHPYRPEGIQKDFAETRTRFCIARIGRQWGKSMISMFRLFDRAIENPDGIYWWVEPTITQAKIHMNRAVKFYKAWIADVNLTDRRITLITGARIFFKGAENRENLEGDTLDGAVLDEAAKLDPEVWTGTVRPMLAVKKGWADIIGKPRGNNWFKRLWFEAEGDEEWYTIHKASNTSPFFSQEEYDLARETTPDLIFRQEYEAEFIDNAGTVFRGVDSLLTSQLEPYNPAKKYYAGVDLARTTDFTVIVIMDQLKRVVAFERFNNVPWSMQKKRIKDKCEEYNAQVLLDSTGVGDPIFDDLIIAGLHKVSGLKFTNESKRKLIEDLIVCMENGEVELADIPELIDELQNFEVDMTPSGLIKYSAPPNQHDDCVIALALANYHCVKVYGNVFDSVGDDRVSVKDYF